MKHRHLVDDVGLTPAAIADILERGKPNDWVELRNVIESDPNGDVSETVLKLCRAYHMYGTSNLWPAYIETLRRERNPSDR